MSASAAFSALVTELLAEFGPVSIRRMFGGAGVFRDGLMFGLIADDVLYLKTDDSSRGRFEAEGLEPFTYVTGKGEKTVMSYHRAPERCMDDATEMAEWARAGFDTALRKAAEKPAKRAKSTAAKPGSRRPR